MTEKRDEDMLNIETFDFEKQFREYEVQGITVEMLKKQLKDKKQRLLRLMNQKNVCKEITDNMSNEGNISD